MCQCCTVLDERQAQAQLQPCYASCSAVRCNLRRLGGAAAGCAAPACALHAAFGKCHAPAHHCVLQQRAKGFLIVGRVVTHGQGGGHSRRHGGGAVGCIVMGSGGMNCLRQRAAGRHIAAGLVHCLCMPDDPHDKHGGQLGVKMQLMGGRNPTTCAPGYSAVASTVPSRSRGRLSHRTSADCHIAPAQQQFEQHHNSPISRLMSLAEDLAPFAAK